eukprot:ANDGO_05728.mRNA.1 hypothetical protein
MMIGMRLSLLYVGLALDAVLTAMLLGPFRQVRDYALRALWTKYRSYRFILLCFQLYVVIDWLVSGQFLSPMLLTATEVSASLVLMRTSRFLDSQESFNLAAFGVVWYAVARRSIRLCMDYLCPLKPVQQLDLQNFDAPPHTPRQVAEIPFPRTEDSIQEYAADNNHHSRQHLHHHHQHPHHVLHHHHHHNSNNSSDSNNSNHGHRESPRNLANPR